MVAKGGSLKSNFGQSPHRNWRAVLIEPFKQLKLGAYVIAITIVFVVLLGLLFIKAFWEQYQQIMEIFAVTRPQEQLQLVTNDIFFRNAWTIGLFLLCFLVAMLTVVIRVTHRYYGPLVAIHRFVQAMTQGDYSRRVMLRRQDELHELADHLNCMAEALERRHGVNKAKSSQGDRPA